MIVIFRRKESYTLTERFRSRCKFPRLPLKFWRFARAVCNHDWGMQLVQVPLTAQRMFDSVGEPDVPAPRRDSNRPQIEHPGAQHAAFHGSPKSWLQAVTITTLARWAPDECAEIYIRLRSPPKVLALSHAHATALRLSATQASSPRRSLER